MKSFCIQYGWTFLEGIKFPLLAPRTIAKDEAAAKLCFIASYPEEDFCINGASDIEAFEQGEEWKRIAEDHVINFELKFPN
jgi:hypothetical protein